MSAEIWVALIVGGLELVGVIITVWLGNSKTADNQCNPNFRTHFLPSFL